MARVTYTPQRHKVAERETRESEFIDDGPTALLAEALLSAEHDDAGRLGVRLTHLVPPVVFLRDRQRHVAALHLAPRHGRGRFVLPLALRCCRSTPAAIIAVNNTRA
jgi:hypothetical protein